MSNKSTRINFGKTEKNLPKLDLLAVRKESWEWFLKTAISEEISNISPIDDFTGKNWQLVLEDPELGNSSITIKKAFEKGLTYSIPLKVKATLINKHTQEKVSQEVFMGDIPQMTSRGTFVISGIERVVINQLVRSPGVYFSGDLDNASGRILYMAEIRPLHGAWLEFEVTKQDIVYVRIDRKKKVLATVFLRALGFERTEEIKKLFENIDVHAQHKYIKKTLDKDTCHTKEDALLEIYKKLRPGEPVLLENAENLFNNMFLDNRRYDLGKVGRYKINKRLGVNLPNDKTNWVITKQDVVGALQYLVGLQNGEGRVDDIDHLSNRRLRRVGELVAVNAFRIGLLKLERSIKEKMSLISVEDSPSPSILVNARPLIASINEFYRTNQLSTILDDTNSLAKLENLRRVSVLGPGGINRDRASFSIRDINSSQYGRIDPVKTPEGPNIGLVTILSLYARVNEYGFIETPYKKLEKEKKGNKTKVRISDETVYMSADDEEEFRITHAGVDVDESDYIVSDRVPFRYKGAVAEGDVELVDYIDVTPRQVVGASASMIPFLAHDEGNRALMGSNMQGQAVPLVNPESPIIGTEMEGVVAESLGGVIRARNEGVVEFVDADSIIIKLDKKTDDLSTDFIEVLDNGKKESYSIDKFKRGAHASTCENSKVVVSPGQKVKKNDLLADGSGIQNGEIALGRNLTIAYTSLDGYGFEDAILVSDRLVKEDLLTSVHIEEHDCDVVDTKLGPEERTKDIPNVSESELADLAEDGIVVIGAEVGPGDILVGKIAPKGDVELTSEERLLRAIFGEKAREVRDTSLRVPHGERGTVISVQVLDREKGDELGPGVIQKVIVKVAQMRKITVGDKIAGRHGNKGVVAKILKEADMPYLADGTHVDIIISPLSVLARMNLGQLLECHLGLAMRKIGKTAALPVFDKVGDEVIKNELKNAGFPVNGKLRLFDGRTGEPFMEDTVVGVAYILKLTHMVEDKTHARSTGPYSLVTQQPLGGKAQMGGQRLGEMEVWALEAHRAAYILQEMLTLKSDDILGRARTFEAIVKGLPIPEATVPEGFRVSVRELNSLGLFVEATGVVEHKENIEEVATKDKSEVENFMKETGAEAVATEELVEVNSPMEVEEVI